MKRKSDILYYVWASGRWWGIVDWGLYDTYYGGYKKSMCCGPGRCGEFEN